MARNHSILIAICTLSLLGCQSRSDAYCRSVGLLVDFWPSFRRTSCTADGATCVLAFDSAESEVTCSAFRIASIYSPNIGLCAAPLIARASGEWTLSVTAWTQRTPKGLVGGRLLLDAPGTDIPIYSDTARADAARYWPKLWPVVNASIECLSSDPIDN